MDPEPDPEAADIALDMDGDISSVIVDPETGAVITDIGDGAVIIDLEPAQRAPAGSEKHDANLAEYIDKGELDRIAQELLLGIQTDETSRQQWIATRADGIKLLGLTIENPRSGTESSVALEGMATVRHPLLIEATLRFQANARGELLPASGPVKVTDKIKEDGSSDTLAEALESDMNYYLTTVATEYYPDTDRMLFYVGFGGCGFKKVYNCPIRRRPVSESVDAKDLIVSDASTDLRNSRRVTHQIVMKPSTLRRMQLAGAYRDVALGVPNMDQPNAIEQEIANVQGINIQTATTETDRDHTIYECYCELNIAGFEDRDNRGLTGLALPYRVVMDKDARVILEVRRNWREDDTSKLAKICFVKYSFVPGLGFYDIGLVHILGNTTNALTAAERELLDAGMFANFPGFIYSKLAGRQNTNEFRVPPGGGVAFESNGQDIRTQLMPLPYKDVSAAFVQFLELIAQDGQRLGGTAEINIGEGKQDAPVGTTLALIEQATKVMDAVHKRLHAAQAEEFQLLKECFRENPAAFVSSVRGVLDWNEDQFIAALEDASIVPMADPNTPSHMHRLMKAMALKQLQAASPELYNGRAVDERVLHMIGIEDAESLFAPVGSQMPNPEAMGKLAELQLKAKEQQLKAANDAQNIQLKTQELALKQQDSQRDAQLQLHDMQVRQAMQARESQDQAADRQSRERIAALNLVSDLVSHPNEQGVASSAASQFGVNP